MPGLYYPPGPCAFCPFLFFLLIVLGTLGEAPCRGCGGAERGRKMVTLGKGRVSVRTSCVSKLSFRLLAVCAVSHEGVGEELGGVGSNFVHFDCVCVCFVCV